MRYVCALWNPKHQPQHQIEKKQWYSSSWVCGMWNKSVTFVESQEILSPRSFWKQKRTQGGNCLHMSNVKMITNGRSPMMRHVSRTHEVALDWLVDRINLDPMIQIKFVDTENQLADLRTQRSFTRDEWCNLLRLLKLMFFSMSSRSHFRSVEKAKTMSKRIQERKTGEELVVAKPRSTCLISRNLLNVKQHSCLGLDAPNVPRNPYLDSESVSAGTRKLARNRDQNPATCSQERNQGGCWKQQRGDVCDCSGGRRKQQCGVENQLDRTRLDILNMQISEYRYVDKVFENLRPKLRLSSLLRTNNNKCR